MKKECAVHCLVFVATLVTVSSLKAHTQTSLSDEPDLLPYEPTEQQVWDQQQARLLALKPPPGEQASKHIWPHSMMSGGKTNIVPPKNLSAHLAWTWHHETGKYGTILAGGPVIDSDNNFYLTGQDHVRKLNSDGKEQWKYRTPSPINNMPALGDNTLFLVDKGGHAIALDLKTGKPLWVKRVSESAGGDSGYPACSQGLFIMGSQQGSPDGGNAKVSALDQKTGDVVWEFLVEQPLWNFQPLFPGDDTVVMMDFTGGMYKLGLRDGEKIWHTVAENSDQSFSDGGAVLGDNGMVYSCSNPDENRGSEGTQGIVRAFDLTNGRQIWGEWLPQPCNSYPAYGLLEGYSEPSVVVTPGSFMGSPTMHGGIIALSAKTGAKQWMYQAPVYTAPNNMAKGDWDGIDIRKASADPYVGDICLPAHWGAPTITGDGKIYVGRADGFLYSLSYPADAHVGDDPRSTEIDFPTSPGIEVDRFNAEGASLHGSNAFAPGIMAFQTCDSLLVFKF